MHTFSLILATAESDGKEITRFFDSLRDQTYQYFELIIVDQNQDDRISRWAKIYANQFSCKIIPSDRGLSKARNIGLKHISGDIVAFPDDDCWYPGDLLQIVDDLLTRHPEWDGITGSTRDEEGQYSVAAWDTAEGLINKYNVMNRVTSASIFLRKSILARIGGFNESLGLGSGTQWNSGEDLDIIMRACEKGGLVYYLPDVIIHHPADIPYSRSSVKKAYDAAKATGWLIKNHNYPVGFFLYKVIRSIGGAIKGLLELNLRKVYYHLKIFQGRIKGYWGK